MVDYSIKKSGNTQKVVIETYKEINEVGQFHYAASMYNGIRDTTYLLSDEVVNMFNKIFNGSRKIQSYMVINKLPENVHYAGGFMWFSCTYPDNTTDSFLVVPPFMDPSFERLIFYDYKWPSNLAYKGKTIRKPLIEKEILKYHNACKYLPKIEQSPIIQ
ncbi:hypothetical protein KXD93_10175 [Mucilaginibacter sp. BJC16-A38]|uniref:hypothetical protein n=1 Tax=Mucilaginibacter phenanthrenivorans TaxID=1234842 RepID=UPI00215801F3|nr:hypothetical protein [Mucilaginibacter phenanthrenivorans]MCR8558011.1 hypothetical protein [Mucilaginibacter phenanthrenivorans]